MPGQVSEARHFVAEILSGHPATDDAVLCLSEIAANSVQHSRSALPGGTFRVRLRRAGAGIRVEVTDSGGPWGTPPDGVEHGRGLRIVRELSDRQDITVTGPPDDPDQRTMAFEIRPR